VVSGELHEALGADGVAGVQHGEVRLGPHHRKVFERHL
jgi:hypothetical protein